MSQKTPTLRCAQPTHEDGLAFARYLDQAAEGFFRFLLGRKSEHILATAFVQPGHDLSFQHVTFAERDGEIVGMASGYSADEHRKSSREPLRRAAGRWNFRMWTTSILFAPLMRILETIGDGEYYLLAVAVDSSARGGGVGSALIDHIEERARKAGMGRLALDVSAKNDGARRLYERRGMRVESRWPRRIRIPGIKLYRMTKSI